MLSFNFILTMTPANISIASPRDEMIRKKLNFRPTNKPRAPIISSKTVVNPNFSKPNRLNSFFICGLIKYDRAYPRKEKLDTKVAIVIKEILIY